MIDDAERREVARRLRYAAEQGQPYTQPTLACFIGADCADVWTRLADLIEPHIVSGGRTILCAHCERVSWCGCEPGDEEGGCDFDPSVTEGEPPYNLYSLYEAVFRRRPRDKYAIDDDEVDELVDALLDICNAPGNERIQRKQPSEPKVKCVAEVKVDGERLEKLAHDAAVELTGIDRDALLALADELYGRLDEYEVGLHGGIYMANEMRVYARRIREALGVKS